MYEKCVNFIGAFTIKKLLGNYDSNDKVHDVPHSFSIKVRTLYYLLVNLK